MFHHQWKSVYIIIFHVIFQSLPRCYLSLCTLYFSVFDKSIRRMFPRNVDLKRGCSVSMNKTSFLKMSHSFLSIWRNSKDWLSFSNWSLYSTSELEKTKKKMKISKPVVGIRYFCLSPMNYYLMFVIWRYAMTDSSWQSLLPFAVHKIVFSHDSYRTAKAVNQDSADLTFFDDFRIDLQNPVWRHQLLQIKSRFVSEKNSRDNSEDVEQYLYHLWMYTFSCMIRRLREQQRYSRCNSYEKFV